MKKLTDIYIYIYNNKNSINLTGYGQKQKCQHGIHVIKVDSHSCTQSKR